VDSSSSPSSSSAYQLSDDEHQSFAESYPGIASGPLPDDILEMLSAPVRDEAVSMLVTGNLYLPGELAFPFWCAY
jgi:hypothetical protein